LAIGLSGHGTPSEEVNTTPQLALSGVEDYNPNTHGFCSTAKDSLNFDLVYDRKKPTSVIDSVGDPKMSFRRVADVNVAMSKRYGMLIAMGVFEMSSIESPGLIFS